MAVSDQQIADLIIQAAFIKVEESERDRRHLQAMLTRFEALVDLGKWDPVLSTKIDCIHFLLENP